MQLLATRNSGAESTIINFSTQMFWLNHHFEAHLLTCTAEEMENLYNQKALGYLYQQWRRGRNGSDSSISITDAGAALLLANSSESVSHSPLHRIIRMFFTRHFCLTPLFAATSASYQL